MLVCPVKLQLPPLKSRSIPFGLKHVKVSACLTFFQILISCRISEHKKRIKIHKKKLGRQFICYTKTKNTQCRKYFLYRRQSCRKYIRTVFRNSAIIALIHVDLLSSYKIYSGHTSISQKRCVAVALCRTSFWRFPVWILVRLFH